MRARGFLRTGGEDGSGGGGEKASITVGGENKSEVTLGGGENASVEGGEKASRPDGGENASIYIHLWLYQRAESLGTEKGLPYKNPLKLGPS